MPVYLAFYFLNNQECNYAMVCKEARNKYKIKHVYSYSQDVKLAIKKFEGYTARTIIGLYNFGQAVHFHVYVTALSFGTMPKGWRGGKNNRLCGK